ncbi:hypothetical protein BAUCODRAFT_122385 [Baudoinia panamericana UAMH 10762]|uniref:Glucose-methanol-choline oxidoreductase N-terminal domain-containing protein n=1 Tax=Baudoinia panamericana (strain UAMH 10762) TaxID=717646 RepID=M2MXS9_BAUPA|nr:uncharacterized protein BAUCODRAFT_122385 [Baudoinia panamericana UAMH 10762]EMC96378.1 hypothetical protein BAUCODRAFT_122385 [Baudoinia panamericana UAMH 10762]
MPVANKLAHGIDEVDIIICGGGLAGCVVAGRLAAADPQLSILVIEGGANNADNPLTRTPALFPANLVPNSRTALWYKSERSDALAGRECPILTGGVLGGGSSINVMLYSRAHKGDFDDWDVPGWRMDDMIPYMRKTETYHGPGKMDTHGSSGPLHIRPGPVWCKRSGEDILSAVQDVGFSVVNDLQDPTTGDLGFAPSLTTIGADQLRLDAATTYLHSLLRDGKHLNLHVLCESKVSRILFDDSKRAVGVEYTPNPDFQIASTATARPRMTVKARKMVALSCGALGSPLVLERSGIGSEKVLAEANVPVVAAVPGVGSNYQDHNLVTWSYKTHLKPEETLDGLLSQRMSAEEAGKVGLLAWSATDIHAKIRPTEAEVDMLGPKFRSAWEKDFCAKPWKPSVLIATANAFPGDPSLVPAGQYFSMTAYTAYPQARGSIHITGPDWEDAPKFRTGFLENDVDVKHLVWAYKKCREIMRRTTMYRGELAQVHPKFPTGSKAALIETDEPLTSQGNVTDLTYSAEDDQAIEQDLRERVGTTWHSMGTCRMGPQDEGGVVDERLNVYGVRGLKVIDLSIPPRNVGANTQMTAYALAEKGADILLHELGLVQTEV